MAAKIFYLVRLEDETGVSGTGIIGEGVRWTDGSVSIRWVSSTPSFVNFEGVPEDAKVKRIAQDHIKCVHGHSGKTKVVWADDETKAPKTNHVSQSTFEEVD